MKVSAQYAASHLDDILSAVESGEEVHIDRPNKPGIRLVVDNAPSAPTPPQTGRRILGAGRRHLFGAGKGLVTVPTDQQWDAMKKELAADMLDGPFFPPEHD